MGFILSWLKSCNVAQFHNENGEQVCQAGYNTNNGTHHRTLRLTNTALIVEDTIADFEHKAILRWRLKPGTWQLQSNEITNEEHTLTVEPKELIKRISLVEGKESRYYYHKQLTPVLEVEFHKACTIKSVYQYK